MQPSWATPYTPPSAPSPSTTLSDQIRRVSFSRFPPPTIHHLPPLLRVGRLTPFSAMPGPLLSAPSPFLSLPTSLPYAPPPPPNSSLISPPPPMPSLLRNPPPPPKGSLGGMTHATLPLWTSIIPMATNIGSRSAAYTLPSSAPRPHGSKLSSLIPTPTSGTWPNGAMVAVAPPFPLFPTAPPSLLRWEIWPVSSPPGFLTSLPWTSPTCLICPIARLDLFTQSRPWKFWLPLLARQTNLHRAPQASPTSSSNGVLRHDPTTSLSS